MCVTSQPNDLCQVVQCREVTFKHAGACITCCPVPESGWLLVGRAGAQRVYSCHAVPGVPCPAPLVSPCRKHRSRYGNHDIPCSRHTPQALVAKQSGQLQPSTIPAARLLMALSFVAIFAQRNLHWQWVRTTRTIKSSVLICWGGGGGGEGGGGGGVKLGMKSTWTYCTFDRLFLKPQGLKLFLFFPGVTFISVVLCDLPHITRLLSWCGLRQANFWMWHVISVCICPG